MQMHMYIACKCRIAPPPSKLIPNYPRADAVHLGKMELSCSENKAHSITVKLKKFCQSSSGKMIAKPSVGFNKTNRSRCAFHA